ncbi:MAG: zincin-like metallopeptidase domain-containing protein [Patescibacteria group bacterium]|nr:zincin-like metallopeptidase domain-containing protein [Patescibacteria group bacterium]
MDTYQVITDRIVGMLEHGTVPWRKPWRLSSIDGAPVNLVSRKAYRGINVFLLACSGYDNPYWLSFNQAKSLGGHVNKGERSTMVVYWNWIDKETGDTDSHGQPVVDRIPFLRYYNVFNAQQCELPDGIVPSLPDRPAVEPIAACESIVQAMPNRPVIASNGGNGAYYRQSTDSVHMPDRARFDKQEEYYSTLFHELTHSTGHRSRLNRKTLTDHDSFGGQNYSREELVAEMGAAFLCGVTGIETQTLDNSGAYIASWLRALKEDKQLVVTAAAQAQKAADYIRAKNNPAGQ